MSEQFNRGNIISMRLLIHFGQWRAFKSHSFVHSLGKWTRSFREMTFKKGEHNFEEVRVETNASLFIVKTFAFTARKIISNGIKKPEYKDFVAIVDTQVLLDKLHGTLFVELDLWIKRSPYHCGIFFASPLDPVLIRIALDTIDWPRLRLDV